MAVTRRCASSFLFAIPMLLVGGCSDDPSGGVVGGSTATGGGGTGGTGGTGGAGGTAGTGGVGGQGGTPPETALIHQVGRFDESDTAGPTSSWSGTAFHTKVDGTSLLVELGGASGVFFQVIVDGAIDGQFVTVDGGTTEELTFAAGTHHVEIFRRNEGFFGNVQLLGLSAGTGSTLVESPRPYDHRIEFIGDSITCGYGIEGPDENCNFSGATESAYTTYAAIAARTLGAEAHLVAYSGKGVYQNYGGDTNELMPELYLRTLTNNATPAWDFSEWIADAVVINLGTNDFSVTADQTSYVTAYVQLLDQVRSVYPAAPIFCVTWAHWGSEHESWVPAAMGQSGYSDLHHVSFAIDSADGWGCDYHPSATTHQKLGQQLATTMQAELGW